MIDNRHPHPTHVRDLLLLAATTAADEHVVDPRLLTDLDVVDVVAVAATLVHGQLQALTAGVRSAEARLLTATEVFSLAQSIARDPQAVGAVGTVVGTIGQGERATAAAIARCIGTFGAAELAAAAVALCAANLLLLSELAGTSVVEIVRWSAGDGERQHVAERSARPVFCTREALDLHERAGAQQR